MLKLKVWRQRRDFSLRALAERAGIHYVTLVNLEAGRGDPQLSTLLKLCKALGITLAELVPHPTNKGGKLYGRTRRSTKG
jgi:transcriptional regulator with XRE-family HTH domain